jgi:hypothetical protein
VYAILRVPISSGGAGQSMIAVRDSFASGPMKTPLSRNSIQKLEYLGCIECQIYSLSLEMNASVSSSRKQDGLLFAPKPIYPPRPLRAPLLMLPTLVEATGPGADAATSVVVRVFSEYKT